MSRGASTGRGHTYAPDTEQGAEIADFVRVLDEDGLGPAQGRPALVAANGERLDVPDATFDVLRQVADALSSGMWVSVAPLDAQLTTQEAADSLRISRPTLVRIL